MLLINQIRIPVEGSTIQGSLLIPEEQSLKKQAAKKLRIPAQEIIELSVVKKSLDARKKPELFWVYSVAVKLAEEKDKARLLAALKDSTVLEYQPAVYRPPARDGLKEGFQTAEGERPVVIGTGPAGLLCGYMLACSGLRPIMVERGKRVDQRRKAVDEFWEKGVLDPDTNVQFGEGGAGTFSDGKLQTQVKDKTGRIRYILEVLVEHGAPREILYLNKPHVGTDILSAVVENLRNNMIELGAEFRFETRMTGLETEQGRIRGIRVTDKQGDHVIPAEYCILCIGHSARDTFQALYRQGIHMENKPFALGLRVQHDQDMINEAQYGKGWENKELPPADYKLTYQSEDGRGIYSFCMCPGGYVVNASSEAKRTAVNGMSYHDRDSGVANSAIVVTVGIDDFGEGVFDGMRFQQELEQKAYVLGQGKLALQRWEDYSSGNGMPRQERYLLEPKVKGQYIWGDIRELLPRKLYDDFVEGMRYFGTRIRGFDRGDAIVCGIESRTSSPVKILRDENTYQSNIAGLFPCGEGAGYAGGITSAALDGVKVAEKVIMMYNSFVEV